MKRLGSIVVAGLLLAGSAQAASPSFVNDTAAGGSDPTFYDRRAAASSSVPFYHGYLIASWTLLADIVLGAPPDFEAVRDLVPFYLLPFVETRFSHAGSSPARTRRR